MSLYVRTCPLVKVYSVLPGLVLSNTGKPNDIKTFLSTWHFIVYKQDLGERFQSACFSDYLMLQTASKTKHVQLSIRWYLLRSHRGTGLLARMPQPTSTAVASKAGN